MDKMNNTFHHRKTDEQPTDKLLPVRNILNLIFMAGAIVGVVLYFFTNKTVGTVVILSAMVFKMAECCLRFFRR